MSTATKIQWTDRTWNPVRGCSMVSAGCANCYAMKQAHRFSGMGRPYENLTEIGPHGPRWNGNIMLVPDALSEPLRWKQPCRVFVNSMSDLFHEDVPDEFILEVFTVMGIAKDHTFQVLTKRPERMRSLLSKWSAEDIYLYWHSFSGEPRGVHSWPLHNVWLGVSIENQETADERIPLLLQTPAAKRFISAEPLLGPIDLEQVSNPGLAEGQDFIHALNGFAWTVGARLDWVIVGGESGPGARPMHPDWARSIRDQCQAAGVPFFFKQWGEWAPGDEVDPGTGAGLRFHYWDAPHAPGKMWRFGKKAAGSMLGGREWKEWPR